MTNPFLTDQYRSLALLLARMPLGIYFLLAGYLKLKGGVAGFVEKGSGMIPPFLPVELGRAYLWGLPFVEILAGVALVVGFYTRVSASLIALMLISFLIAGGLQFTIKQPPYYTSNVMFLGLALVLISTGGGRIAVDASMNGGDTPGPSKR